MPSDFSMKLPEKFDYLGTNRQTLKSVIRLGLSKWAPRMSMLQSNHTVKEVDY